MDSDIATGIPPSEIDWHRVRLCEYEVRQRFNYTYPAPIHDLRHQLVVVPPARYGDQVRQVYAVSVSEPGEISTRLDSFANTVLDARIPVVKEAIDFNTRATIERSGPPGPRTLRGDSLTDARLLEHTTRTAVDPAVIEVAESLRGSGPPDLALAERINAWVHDHMTYEQGITGIRTTAAEALSQAAGVCQDYSHLMIAICRHLGLRIFYVSGHLLGDGATHSWVEVVLPAGDGSDRAQGWALDPTHGRRVDLTYLTVAVGRDYGDVAPTSGRYRAGHGGQLVGHKEVRVTKVAYEE